MINYSDQQIELSGRYGMRLVTTAVVALRTGLAYHPVVSDFAENSQSLSGYIVTQLNSGKSLGLLTVETPRQARKWIELLVQLTDWNTGFDNLTEDRAFLTGLASRVEQARRQAVELSIFVDSDFTAIL